MNYELARHNMIEQQIRPWYVLDKQVLHILGEIPREDFTPQAYRHLAYADFEIPLPNNQMMLCPKVVARALTALQCTSHDKILEIGTGTGYVTALLAQQAKEVVSVEIYADLLERAEKNLRAYRNCPITLQEGDAACGWEKGAPYDVIFATGSYPSGIPQELFAQLKPGGRLFAINGQSPRMEAFLFKRLMPAQMDAHSLFETCVPPLINVPMPPAFHF